VHLGSSGQKLIKYTSSLAQQLGKVTPPKKMDVQSEQSLEWEIFEDRYQLNLVRGHAFCALLDFDHLISNCMYKKLDHTLSCAGA
jgi:hypothetical protein